MPTNLEKQIEEEHSRIVSLLSSLDEVRTPWMKGGLRSEAANLKNIAAQMTRAKDGSWDRVAILCLQIATLARESMQATVEKYGGPDNVIEVGG